MARLRYDEFDDEIIAPFWSTWNNPPGVEVSETPEGDLQWYCSTDCVNQWKVQELDSFEDFDAWCKITLPDRDDLIGSDASAGMWWDFGNNNHFHSFGFLFSDTSDNDGEDDCTYSTHTPITPRQYVLRVSAWNNDDWSCIEHAIKLGDNQSSIWLRMRFSLGKVSFYYALTEPQFNQDWILDTADFVTGDMNVEEPYIGWSQWGNTGNHTDKTFKVAYLREWVSRTPSSRVRPKQLKLDNTIPTVVSDLKDGEMRITATDMYARVGNQILSMAFSTALSFTTTTTTTT